MPMIDADTHVDESEATWKKLEGTSYAKYIPVTVTLPPDEAKRAGYNPTNSRCWVVEGRLQNRAIRDEVNHPLRVYRELQDVPGRLAHMDRMGVDIQVIFPTFFIRYNTGNGEAEWALTTTYNRWMAEKCANTDGRLRWAAVLPLLQPDKAVEQLRWAKQHGARGSYKRGFDLERNGTDPIDDIESLLQFGTEDNLMIGTDYSHTDISANLSGLDEVRSWVDEGRITKAQGHKILETNSQEFYGL